MTELCQGRAARGRGGGVRGGSRLGVVSIAYTPIDGNKANTFLAAYVGTVRPRVRESLLTVGALIWLLTCKLTQSMTDFVSALTSKYSIIFFCSLL